MKNKINFMNFNQIIKLIAKDISYVNLALYKQLNSKIVIINKLSKHTIEGGKLIRPIISILIAKALHYKGNKHIHVATFIEFIHAATLLHDDVIDNSKIRRGKTTTNIEFGNAASVLIGDFMYTHALQIMIKLKSFNILTLMSKALNIIAEGEILQLIHCHDPDLTIDDYMKVIYSKTAKLFEVASQSSAILAGADNYQELSLCNYGKYLGIAFQLIDDLMDYSANEKLIGKDVGNDLNEGKITLPILHAIQNCSSIKEVSIIRQAIKLGNHRHLLHTILNIMHQCGSLEYTYQCAQNEISKAIACLRCLSISPYKHALESLAQIILHRNV